MEHIPIHFKNRQKTNLPVFSGYHPLPDFKTNGPVRWPVNSLIFRNFVLGQ